MNRRNVSTALFTLAAVALFATSAWAHAVVYPKRADPGAYQKYVLRVPNERDQPTTKVEMQFPANVRVISFADVEGWKLDVQMDSAKRIIGATWTGTLPPRRFVEFPFIAVNPAAGATIVWPAYQTYADGQRVEWTGPEGADKPASTTIIGNATPARTNNRAPAGGPDAIPADSGGRFATPLAMIAIVIAMVALGFSLRRREA